MNGFEKRSLEKKKQILAAAFDIMNSAEGADGLTVDAVVRESGISKATIFKYFGSKENLIRAVFFRLYGRNGRVNESNYGKKSTI
ncbi:TetR/AcrR family transcriptional regulator [Listeria floridensis]|uniref:TetR/AcrR family transcriptional regulator n=1 Tax=Listeria floridensis TaxID=1494962 RepID=UPI0004BB4EE2|nr:TetR/AcrR family transcriptional regulator [Listeria floridensis]